MLHKNIPYRRYQRERHIRRKEHILKLSRADNMPKVYDASDVFAVYRGDDEHGYQRGIGSCRPYWYVKARGQLSKGKIHCSCHMCRFAGYTMQDRRTAERMLYAADFDERSDARTLEAKLKREVANSKTWW